jgi:hypothetical protein
VLLSKHDSLLKVSPNARELESAKNLLLSPVFPSFPDLFTLTTYLKRILGPCIFVQASFIGEKGESGRGEEEDQAESDIDVIDGSVYVEEDERQWKCSWKRSSTASEGCKAQILKGALDKARHRRRRLPLERRSSETPQPKVITTSLL